MLKYVMRNFLRLHKYCSTRAIRAAVLSVLVSLLALSAPCQPLRLLVPAYFYPGGAELADWDALAAAAKIAPVSVIFNPGSGPGTLTDPNYVVAVTKVRDAGGTMYAYVYTSNATRPLAEVTADFDGYARLYPGLFQGFFLDEVAGDASPASVAYYAALRSNISQRNASYRIIGNPGVSTPIGYLANGVFDTEVRFETYAAEYVNFSPETWTKNYTSPHIAHVLHTQPSQANMLADLKRAQQRNAGYVFVTDDPYTVSHTNPYDRLPVYWQSEVAAVVEANRTVVLSGSVTLEGVADLAQVNPAAPLGTFHISFRTPGTTTEEYGADVTLTPAAGNPVGAFTVNNAPVGAYDVAIKGAKNLRVVLKNQIISGAVTLPSVILPAGDANGDNSSDSSDFTALIGAFNSDANIPGSGYDPAADFNFDGSVDSGDFTLLIGEFNNVGAP